MLLASVVAAVLASVLLIRRSRAYRELSAVEEADVDGDGIPDVYRVLSTALGCCRPGDLH